MKLFLTLYFLYQSLITNYPIFGPTLLPKHKQNKIEGDRLTGLLCCTSRKIYLFSKLQIVVCWIHICIGLLVKTIPLSLKLILNPICSFNRVIPSLAMSIKHSIFNEMICCALFVISDVYYMTIWLLSLWRSVMDLKDKWSTSLLAFWWAILA